MNGYASVNQHSYIYIYASAEQWSRHWPDMTEFGLILVNGKDFSHLLLCIIF